MMKHPGDRKKVKIIPSSSVILLRENKNTSSIETYLAKRREELKFFPGLYSGIGGKIAETDLIFSAKIASLKILKKSHQELNHLVCAWRELLEEVGIFYYETDDVELISDVLNYSEKNSNINLQELFNKFSLNPEKMMLNNFVEAGFRNTPEFTNIQFGTQFYFLFLEHSENYPKIKNNNLEFEIGLWESPEYFFQNFKSYNLQTSPPVLGTIRALTKFPLWIIDEIGKGYPITASNYLKNKDTLPIGLQVRIEAHPGIEIIPFKSLTRPPATTTNLISIGEEKKIIIDPGTHLFEEKRRLDLIMDKWIEKGDEILFQIITHHHQDHWNAAIHLKEKYNVPIATHPAFHSNVEINEISSDILLTNNQLINLGMDKYNNIEWKLKIKFLSGHTSDHIVIIDQRFGALISGDLISGLGTVIIEDYEGYMKSLEYLKSLNITTIFPGHGPVIIKGKKIILDYIEHRKMREKMIFDFIKENKSNTLSKITREVYNDIPTSFLNIAEQQVKVYLEYFIKKEYIAFDEINGFFVPTQ